MNTSKCAIKAYGNSAQYTCYTKCPTIKKCSSSLKVFSSLLCAMEGIRRLNGLLCEQAEKRTTLCWRIQHTPVVRKLHLTSPNFIVSHRICGKEERIHFTFRSIYLFSKTLRHVSAWVMGGKCLLCLLCSCARTHV